MSAGPASRIPDAERVLNSLPLAVLLIDPASRIASVNPAAEQFFGQSARRIRGRRLTEILAFAEPRMAERLGDSETPVSAREIAVSIAGGAQRRIDITAAPVADAQGWQLVSIHDNSTVEALGEDSGDAGNSVLRGPEILAHEIRNPLAGIRGAAQLLGRKLEGSERKLTELIAAEVDRIATLIEQMQLLSGKTRAPVAPCNLHEIVRRAAAILEAAEGQAALPCSIAEEFDPSLPAALGNGDALVQVVINLLVNAGEACRDTKNPRVVVRTRFASGLQLHTSPSGETVRLPVELRVSDNGPGVPPSLREHIFEPFVTTKKSGQGLGLALVRKLVRDMNGRISHERDDAGGMTHFRIHLPMAQTAKRAHGGKKVLQS